MTMSSSLITVAYLASAVLFILALSGLSSNDTARRGNLFGIIGMIIAVVVTIAAFVTRALIYVAENSGTSIRWVDPATEETGSVTNDVVAPNGLILSPDEQPLRTPTAIW